MDYSRGKWLVVYYIRHHGCAKLRFKSLVDLKNWLVHETSFYRTDPATISIYRIEYELELEKLILYTEGTGDNDDDNDYTD
jgi:hypothetical protein